MGTIDIVILACFLPAVIIGLKNGFIKQLVALCVVVGGIWLAVHFSDRVGAFLSQWITLEPFWIKVISFAAIFIVVALATSALVIGTLVYLVNSANSLINFIPEEKIAESRFYKPLLEFVQTVFPYLKSLF